MASLEEMYNSAGSDTYVGQVRTLQAEDRGAGRGVNFLDGDGRGKFSPGLNPAPDQFQDEFKRNTAGSYRYGGGGKVPGTYDSSRWLEKSLKLAFDGEGPSSLPTGYFLNNKFNPQVNGEQLHKFAPLPGRTLLDNTSPFTRAIVVGSSVSGRLPLGLAG